MSSACAWLLLLSVDPFATKDIKQFLLASLYPYVIFWISVALAYGLKIIIVICWSLMTSFCVQELIVTGSSAVLLFIMASYYRWWICCRGFGDLKSQAYSTGLVGSMLNLAVKFCQKMRFWSFNMNIKLSRVISAINITCMCL